MADELLIRVNISGGMSLCCQVPDGNALAPRPTDQDKNKRPGRECPAASIANITAVANAP